MLGPRLSTSALASMLLLTSVPPQKGTVMNATHLASHLNLLKESLLEVLWPTRCIICDLPDHLICPQCLKHLPYIDYWQACKCCGAEYGQVLCCECNSMILATRGLEHYPLDGCVSVFRLTPTSRRIVTMYKDRNEKRLSLPLAHLLANIIVPAWKHDAIICPIPARPSAKRRRGFDHMETIAADLQAISNMPYSALLQTTKGGDQRVLNAKERLKNMKDSFQIKPEVDTLPARVIIIDDVLTTGSTLFAAAHTLKQAGVNEVFGVTLARV